jgi:predicted glycosyltransferase
LTKKTILVAPLFWGLGHAARCIPIIKALLSHNYNVLLGSDGASLLFLRKEFPTLSFVELPSYNIVYPNNGKYFKWKMFLSLPTIQKAILSEKKIVRELVSEAKVDGIISDNRFGIRNNKVPSVFITHQLNVLTGSTTFLSSKIHQKIIKKFNQCWIPDIDSEQNISGKLGRLRKPDSSIKYIGLLSRF